MAKEPITIPSARSLEDVHRSVQIPPTRWWRRLFAFTGPAYLVSVGYMDPGNWATDLEGGAQFGYALLWVLLMSNVMAILLQTLSARLGLVTGRDLAQACHDDYPPAVNAVLFVLCEIAIAACDLAEVLGTAIGLNLLFGLPVLWGVLITGGDVFVLLAVQRFGMRKMEAMILVLISIIGACFVIEVFLSKPSIGGIAGGLLPSTMTREQLYVAIGILGATVMPHNLYLHSALVQSRDVTKSRQAVTEACKYNLVDSAVALNFAFLINAAILIVAAATFFGRAGIELTDAGKIEQAHAMLERTLGSGLAPIAFALALICAGQSSTLTGTLAGQITMEGFLRFRVRPWLRRLVTRMAAIVPAVIVILSMGEQNVFRLLILSQVILSLQLPFAVVPLVRFTSSKHKMGPFANRRWVAVLAWVVSAIIIALNATLVFEEIRQAVAAAGRSGWLVAAATIPPALGMVALLGWMIFRRERVAPRLPSISPGEVAARAAQLQKRFRKIGVALEATPRDAIMLAEAVALARTHQATLVLMHVVEGAGGQWHGPQTGDTEGREDESYLQDLAERLRGDLQGQGVPGVEAVLAYGDVPRGIREVVRREGIDMLVVGGHGHRGLLDWLYGQTIPSIRHNLSIPIFAVRE